MTQNPAYIGAMVAKGDGPQGYDWGEVVALRDGQALVAWRGAETRNWVSKSDLRPYAASERLKMERAKVLTKELDNS